MYGPNAGSRESSSPVGLCSKRCREMICTALRRNLVDCGYKGLSVLRFMRAFFGIVKRTVDG